MIPEIGHFLLWIALGVSLLLSTVPLIGATQHRPDWMAYAKPAVFVLFGLVSAAFLCLAVSFSSP